MSLKNKSILVTGGAGFIGSHLVYRLIKEYPENLIVVDNFFLGQESNLHDAKQNYSGLKIYKQDASDYEGMQSIIQNEGIEVIFNLAIIPLPTSLIKPAWTYTQNVNITLTLCEIAKKNNFDAIIHFSSSEVYGTCEYAPMDEKHPLNPTTPYGASKAAADQLIFSYHSTFGLEFSIIRPFNNYGPRQNEGTYAGVIPLTIKRILNGEAPVIYGDGNQTRDFLYVTDTADAAVKIYNIKNTRGKILNVASGKETSINTVVKLIADYLNYDKPIEYQAERPGDVRRHISNIYLAEDLINFKPKIPFEEGIKYTIEWYKSNFKKRE